MKNYYKALFILTLQNIYIIKSINTLANNNKKFDKNIDFENEIRKIYDSFGKVNINQIDKKINKKS